MRLAGATEKLRKYLGLALLPQAGVAIGLVVLLEEDPAFRTAAGAQILPIFVAVVLTVVTASEIVGPILTRFALARAGEIGHDRLRLIDFLQEENIVIDPKATTMDQAIEILTQRLVTLAPARARGVRAAPRVDQGARGGHLDVPRERPRRPARDPLRGAKMVA